MASILAGMFSLDILYLEGKSPLLMSNIQVNFGDILPETSKSSAFWDMGVDSHLKWLLMFSPNVNWDGTSLLSLALNQKWLYRTVGSNHGVCNLCQVNHKDFSGSHVFSPTHASQGMPHSGGLACLGPFTQSFIGSFCSP